MTTKAECTVVILSSGKRATLKTVLSSIWTSSNVAADVSVILIDTSESGSVELRDLCLQDDRLQVLWIPFAGYALTRQMALEQIVEGLSEGSVVVFLDDDNALHPSSLRHLVGHAIQERRTLFGGQIGSQVANVENCLDEIQPDLKSVKYVGASPLAFNAAMTEDMIRWLDTEFNYSGGEDTVVCIRAAKEHVQVKLCRAAMINDLPRFTGVENPQSESRLLTFHNAWLYSAISIEFSDNPLRTRVKRLLSGVFHLSLTLRNSDHAYEGLGTIVGALISRVPDRRWVRPLL